MEDQAALLRLAFDPSMQQVVEVALGILPTANKTPTQILEKVMEFIRARRNVALDRAAFRECRQGATETFDEFYIRLRNLADPADLCAHCVDQQLATGIITRSHSIPDNRGGCLHMQRGITVQRNFIK